MDICDSSTTMRMLISEVREFLRERDWEKYHNPKDLAESICIEAAELLRLFQWVNPEESKRFREDERIAQRIKEELADVVLYCLSMANTMDIDVAKAVLDKIKQNREKYPADLYRGRTTLTCSR